MEALRRLEGGMPSLTLEKRYRRKDGTTLWGSSSVSALRGPDGRYEGSVAVVIDIGEHKRLEQSLRDQADRLELALQTGRLGTWHLDLTTLETQASDQCKANFGLQPHEALNFHRAFEELIHPEDRDAMRAALTQTITAHGDYDADFRVVWPDGSVHWIVSRGRAVYDADGRAVAMTGVNFDDTERRGAMDRLRENEAQLRRTVEDAPLALCLHADDGEILNLSRHWTELTGYTKKTRRSCRSGCAARTASATATFHEAIERIFGGDHAMVQTDIEILTRNGVPRTWSLAASSPGLLKDGRRYVVAMALDITERKRAEALMRRSAARAAFRVSLSDLLRPLSDTGRDPVHGRDRAVRTPRRGPDALRRDVRRRPHRARAYRPLPRRRADRRRQPRTGGLRRRDRPAPARRPHGGARRCARLQHARPGAARRLRTRAGARARQRAAGEARPPGRRC